MDGSSNWNRDVTPPGSGDNLEASCFAAAPAVASGLPAPVASRFCGPQRRPNPHALPAHLDPSGLHRHAAQVVDHGHELWAALASRLGAVGRSLRGRWAAPSAVWRHLLAEARAFPLTWGRQRVAAAVVLPVVLAAAVGLGGAAWHADRAQTASARGTEAVAATAVVAPTMAGPATAAPAVEAPAVVDEPAPPALTSAQLLSEVSTMDLMMPIAEPDLDITSRHSLWAQIGKAYDLDPLLLYSVALVESKSLHPNGKIAPTPWLFRVDDHLVRGDRQHVQLQMAAASQFGSAVQDVGIMQVYYPMHRDAVRDPLTLLDPRTNITVAAKILRAGMRRTDDRVMGVGYYHSRTPSLAKGYGTAVLTVYDRLKVARRKARASEPQAR